MSSPALHSQIAEIFNNGKLQKYASGQGLQILRTAWEDTGRSKNSSWGPNISDMTLAVAGTRMPIIRQPNFEDVSADLAIEKFNVTVGNETGSKPHRIPLKQYINEIGKWTGIGGSSTTSIDSGMCSSSQATGTNTGAPGLKNYLLERDSRILTSAQCCVLPLRDGKVEFAVELYNYQSRPNDPAVLVVVASTAGTSAQVLDRSGKVLFQKKDRALNYMITRSQDFVVERVAELKKERPNEAVEVLEKEARAEALERGCVQIFQIPLKQRPPPASRTRGITGALGINYLAPAAAACAQVECMTDYGLSKFSKGSYGDSSSDEESSNEGDSFEEYDSSEDDSSSAPSKKPAAAAACAPSLEDSSEDDSSEDCSSEDDDSSSSPPSKKPAAAAAARSPATVSSSPPARGIEAGVVQEGSDAGSWCGISSGAAWERDERFPIRATIQFYTVTDTLDISEQVFREFAGKIRDVFSYGTHQGSLVTATSNRVTESGLPQAPAASQISASPLGPWASSSPQPTPVQF
jgi:hypothetical protein